MPHRALLHGAASVSAQTLVASAFLVHAIEYCSPPEVVAGLDERVEDMAQRAAPHVHAQLLLVQREIERPLSIAHIDATRRLTLATALAEARGASRDTFLASMIESVEEQLLDPPASIAEVETGSDPFTHRPDAEWLEVERAAYQGVLRFPRAYHLPSPAICAERAAWQVARQDRERRERGEPVASLARLCAIARTAGRRCAISAWRALGKHSTPPPPSSEAFYADALASLSLLPGVQPLRRQALLLGELVCNGEEARAKDAPHRRWLDMKEGNFKVTRGHCREAFRQILEERPASSPTVAHVIEGLAPAALFLAECAIHAQTAPSTKRGSGGPAPPSAGGEPGARPGSQPPVDPESPTISEKKSMDATVLGIIVQRAVEMGATVPGELFAAAEAGLVGHDVAALLEARDPARMRVARTHARSRRQASLVRAAKSLGTVIVTLADRVADGARRLAVEVGGAVALPQMSLRGEDVEMRPEETIELRLPDADARAPITLRVRENPESQGRVDLAFVEVPEAVTALGLCGEHDSSPVDRSIEAARLRQGLVSRVLRAVPVGEYRLWARDARGNAVWRIELRPGARAG